MRIATKIISGYGVLLALMAALTTYQVIVINRMQSINRNISNVSFRTAFTALDLRRNRDLVHESVLKLFVAGAPEYEEFLRGAQEDFESNLNDLKSLVHSDEEQAEIQLLSRLWISFIDDLTREKLALEPGKLSEIPPHLEDLLERLRLQTHAVYQAALRAIESQVDSSRETGREAETISWYVAWGALLLSALVSFFIVRSISVPLRQLTEGTRAITKGRFFFRANTEGNDEFSQLARDFNTMVNRLDALDQMKKDFVSHVSHELKAPLASMQETIQLLLEGIPGPLTEKQKRFLELNLKSGRRLYSMIANLLDLSRMEAGAMEYELKSCDLASFVRNTIPEFEAQIQERKLNLVTHLPNEPVTVDCDSDRIVQVVSNLFTNAIKFSPEGGTIEVCVSSLCEIPAGAPEKVRKSHFSSADGKSYNVVSISDRGPGVPDLHKEKIFEKFHQVKQGKKLPGQGVGLGLAICKTIIEAHGGAIWVEDNPEGGSVFRLMLQPGGGAREVSYRVSPPL